MPFTFSRICISRTISAFAFVLLFTISPASAQSTDVRFPTPIGSNEISGSIVARDIGDARLTDHFYTFNGLPGDLLITVESKNLNGDFDVFTAAELRPVLKVVVYAESGALITKNIYLRKPESLILRVEARTPNDDEGNYKIRFSGTFAPVEGALIADAKPTGEADSKPTRSSDRRTSRVTSAGARIDEPREEVAAAPTPEPTAASVPEDVTAPPKKVPPVRNPRTRRAPAPRTTSTKTGTGASVVKKTEKPSTDDSETVKEKPEPTTAAAVETRTSSGRRPPARPTRTVKPKPTAENGQLVIDVNDGTRIEYPMNTVSKLTIENGEVVIVSADGYTKRVPLTSILKMSIGP
ncbi:MAG TPA: hypothetical protein VN643_02005 [Pyrinomonadaceae bacterium]|nr:hypothetical protein [Pyrinomonadaceae bacterium]